MESAGQNGCDGCGREFSSAELYPVELPSGGTAICCPECREHAKSVAEKQSELVATGACDGCGDQVPTDDLTEIALPDGATVECCPECAAEAREPTSDGDTDADRTETSPDDGEPSTGAQAGRDGDANRCDQCLETYSIELYEVVTVDDRTERLCPDCKRDAVEEGIITSVRMRRAEAYRILNVDGPVGEDDLRDAYLDRVQEVHPDRENGDRDEFMRVQRAFDRLTGD